MGKYQNTICTQFNQLLVCCCAAFGIPRRRIGAFGIPEYRMRETPNDSIWQQQKLYTFKKTSKWLFNGTCPSSKSESVIRG